MNRTAQERLIRLLKKTGELELARVLQSCHAQCSNIGGCHYICPYGQSELRRRRIEQARSLMAHYGPPFYRVRYVRVNFSPPVGQLHTVKVLAAKRLQKHFCTSLVPNGIAAVGLFKGTLNSNDERWLCEADQLVAGCDIDDLEERFRSEEPQGMAIIRPVNDPEVALQRVFRDRLERLEKGKYLKASNASFELKLEHIRWQLSTGSSRLFLYGCDRDFRPRVTIVKVRHGRRPRKEKPERLPTPPGYYEL